MYPNNWPRCPHCGDFALDGHITCGRVECDESNQRSLANDPIVYDDGFMGTSEPQD